MEDADAAAMAEAMGFSSFGAQPNKRRKFNPGADAFVASAPTATSVIQTSSNLIGGAVASGSNSTPLGTRTQNHDEIALDLNDDDGVKNGSSAVGPGDIRGQVDGDDPEPQYLDTSRPLATASEEPSDNLQAKIDSIVGTSHEPQSRSLTLPVFNPGTRGGRGGRGGYQSAHGRGLEQNKKWWEDYYDPSSNVNPWERLEQDHGLKPRGCWMTWEEAKR